MKERTDKIIKVIAVIAIIFFIGYIIFEELEARKATKIFCKEQCNYNSEDKKWELDLRSAFEDQGILEWESRMELVKSFPEKDLDECVEYCIDAGEHLKDLLYPPEERYD